MSTIYRITHESIFGENIREFSNLQDALDWIETIAVNGGNATLTTETR